MRKSSNEYLEYLCDKRNISENTRKSYKNDLNKMVEYFHLYKIMDYQYINETNLDSYILHMELKGASSSTVLRNIAVIKGYFDYLFRTHKIDKCITEDIKRPSSIVKATTSVDNSELRKLMKAMEGSASKDLRDFAIIKLMFESQITVSEIVAMEVSGVDFQLGFVETTRRGKLTTYKVKPSVMNALLRYMESGRSNIVTDEQNQILFPNMTGARMSRQGVWKMVKTHARKLGMDDINLSRLSKGNGK